MGQEIIVDNLILLDFDLLGEIIFRGQATITNGLFDFEFVVPRDIGIPVGNGKISFYAKTENPTFRINPERVLMLKLEE